MTIACDTREPWPHPWEQHLPPGWSLFREGLETGDFAVAALPQGTLVERKSVSDFLACIGRERERFERELKRGRYAGRLLVIVEGTLQDVLAASRGISRASILGTTAAWASRYAPIIFAGSVPLAADLAFRCLGAQIRDIKRAAAAIEAAA